MKIMIPTLSITHGCWKNICLLVCLENIYVLTRFLFRLMDFRILIRMNFLGVTGALRREWLAGSDEFSATADVLAEAEDHLTG